MKLVDLRGVGTVKACDASCYVWPDASRVLRERGYRVIYRYVRLWDAVVLDAPDGKGESDSLSRRELAELLADGWMVGLVQFGWPTSEKIQLSSATGETAGRNAAACAAGLGMPPGMPIFCDLEFSQYPPPAGRGDRCILHMNAWHRAVTTAGYQSGIYLGGNLGISARDLYYRLATRRYWLSAVSGQPQPVTRGVQIRQTPPRVIPVGKRSIEIDENYIQEDMLGDWPVVCAA